MKGFFKYVMAGMLGTIIALIVVLLLSVITIIGVASSSSEDIETEENSVLLLDFSETVADRTSSKPDFFDLKIKKQLGIRDLTTNIENAAKDDNIKGIYLELSGIEGGIATIEEVRNALLKFKESKKFIVAHADYYTHKSYYLASVADKVYLTPEGEIQFIGLSASITMYKSLLEKLGVEPEIIRHGKFKSAIEPFILDEISEANREQTQKFMGSIWNTIVKGVSTQRNISVEKLNEYADSLYLRSAKTALEYKFVDGLLYKDQVYNEIRTLLSIKETEKISFIEISKYNNAINKPKIDELVSTSRNKIAVIYAVGEIGMGEGDDESIGSKNISEAIRKARKDSSIKAIVLRVNSPGGSALASEIIWREAVLAQKEKPFIVSMGNVAASGGYYIACAADTILAQPNTITGSIGVFGVLFNAKELMSKVGVNVSTVATNSFSDLGSTSRKITAFERGIIQQGVEDVYTTFITHVAQGRGMTVEEIDNIGQGRVWSGIDALEIGLVDVMGGLGDAIVIAAEKAGVEKYRIKTYPEKDKYQKMAEKLFAEAKVSFIKEELGSSYKYLERIKILSKQQGIQARIPYFIDIN